MGQDTHSDHGAQKDDCDDISNTVCASSVGATKDIEVGQSASEKRLPMWKLLLAAIPWIGVQALWSTEFAVTTPYMKELGMTESLATLTWIFAPITGFFTAPIVGSLSDRCESRHGRRRPFILFALGWLWASSLLFASSRHLFPAPFAKWFALLMFACVDVAVNLIQTPLRAIVSDMTAHDQQAAGQIISVLFQGFGNLLGFGIMRLWEVPSEHMFSLMALVLGVLTAFIALQLWVCEETPWVKPRDAPAATICAPLANAFSAVSRMPADLVKLAFVQFCSWYALFCYLPSVSDWFSINVYAGDSHAPVGSVLRARHVQSQSTNTTAGLINSVIMILFSAGLILLMRRTRLPMRFCFSACLCVGAIALVMAKFLVGHSVGLAEAVVALMAIPVSGINAFPFALVGLMNKRAQQDGRPQDTGVQMGVLNIFICLPQIFATLVMGALRARLGDSALPWGFFMAGLSFAVAGVGSLALDDRNASK